MSNTSDARDIAAMIDKVRKLPGWRVEEGIRMQWKVFPPTGAPIFVSKTPTDFRTVRNFRAALRRAGARV